MLKVLGWLAVIGLASLALVVASLALAVWRLRVRNRLHRSLPTTAPLGWLWSPWPAARLHRRLRRAVATAGYRGARRRPARRDEALDALTDDLVREAVALDRRLVATGLLPGPLRRAQLHLAADDVGRVEELAARLAGLAVGHSGGRLDLPGLDQLQARVASLEEAVREIDGLEALLQLPADPLSSRRLDRPGAA